MIGSVADAALMGLPDVAYRKDGDPEEPLLCSVCLRPASNMHHAIMKGAGGVSEVVDRRIPRVALCGSGNLDGCHGDAHRRKLHFDWRNGGWRYLRTDCPTRRDDALEMDGWMRLPGWEMALMDRERGME
jgi:hypothetical protein